MPDAALLHSLQEVDSALARLKGMMESSSEAENARAAAERYEKAVRARRHAQVALFRSEQALRSGEAELAGVQERIGRLEAKIYGGGVNNPKELASLEERLGAERRKKEALEESVLAAMDELEKRRAQLEKVERLLPKIERERDEANSALGRARAGWSAEMARLESRRRAIVAGLDPGAVSAYESLAPRTGGRPVAKVVNRTCDGCHVALPTSARQGETARCPNCGRLLWWPS